MDTCQKVERLSVLEDCIANRVYYRTVGKLKIFGDTRVYMYSSDFWSVTVGSVVILAISFL
jgi:hypothetical protein